MIYLNRKYLCIGMLQTTPKSLHPEGMILRPEDLAAGRYGTYEMVRLWGAEQTMAFQLRVQGQAALSLSAYAPTVVPLEQAREIAAKATLASVSPQRIRELEAKTGHDIIGLNAALEEVLTREAAVHVNNGRTSADTTQSARALQLKASLEVIADSVENLRDILIEKAVEWKDVPHMDCTHLCDALPTVLGRPFAHYGEMLQSSLDWLLQVYVHSIKGKWADATGNHHSLTTLGVNGIELEQQYCDTLGVGRMIAPAQVPGLEFEADIFYVMARVGENLNNVARYVAWGRSDDVNIFVNKNPRKKKGSSAMPHKDAKNGNPTTEEQVMSWCNYLRGNLMTAMANCEMPYARNLAASANSRLNFEDGFKVLDHGIRGLAEVVYWLGVREERCRERVERSYGVVTSPRVLTFLTDPQQVTFSMVRSEAHDLLGTLATKAWDEKVPFVEVLLREPTVMSRLSEATVRALTDPFAYIGHSKEIIKLVRERWYQRKTFTNP